MKALMLLSSVIFIVSCSAPAYLTSNKLAVTSVTIVDGKKIVEVCGISNQNKPMYSYYHDDSTTYTAGDTIILK